MVLLPCWVGDRERLAGVENSLLRRIP